MIARGWDVLRGVVNREVGTARVTALAVFRVLFGLHGLWWVEHVWRPGMISHYYWAPLFNFSLVDGLVPLPLPGMYAVFVAMAVGALGIALGAFHRLSTAAFLLTFSYVFLLEKATYNNHYVFIILVGAVLLLAPVNAVLSVDAWRGRAPSPSSMRGWVPLVLHAQVVLLYTHAALAKFTPDWLEGYPLRIWLPERGRGTPVEALLAMPETAVAMSWAGLLFDLFVGPALLWKRTRGVAMLGVVGFHLVNKWMFDIGVFHTLMISTLVLFVAPERVMGVVERVRRSWPRFSAALPLPEGPAAPTPVGAGTLPSWVAPLVAAHLLLQAVVPLRHLAYPGNFAWTEAGRRFAWQVKARDKRGWVAFTVADPATGTERKVSLLAELNRQQSAELALHPDMMWQYARHLAENARAEGVARPEVRVRSLVSINGRPPQPLVDPEVNLAEAEFPTWGVPSWVLPEPTSEPSAIRPILPEMFPVRLAAGAGAPAEQEKPGP